MKTYRVTYTGNNLRFRNFEIEMIANSEREAVEKAYRENLSDNYFPQDDGSIKDCDGYITASPDSSNIEFDGGFFVAEDITDLSDLINWSELSRYIIGGDRNGIRSNKIPPKHIEALDRLFKQELPEWWERRKKETR